MLGEVKKSENGAGIFKDAGLILIWGREIGDNEKRHLLWEQMVPENNISTNHRVNWIRTMSFDTILEGRIYETSGS